MSSPDFQNRLRERRNAAGWTQLDLARRTCITRQSLIHLESGRFVPSTTVALRLARAFGCRVEDLFSISDVATAVRADLAPSPSPVPSSDSTRVVLGFIGGRWIAHPLYGEESLALAADGIVVGPRVKRSTSVAVEVLRSEAEARENLVVTGCDPALTRIACWLGEGTHGVRVRVLHAPSRQAIATLADGLTHVAGTHLLDETSGEYNVPFVRRACAKRGAIVLNLARWEAGFVVRSGNPLAIHGAEDLARRRVRLVTREPGSGARSLLDRLLRTSGIPAERTHPIAEVARGHLPVARAIACGTADVGVATRGAAAAYGLGFVPLAEERSDLVVGADLRDDPRIGRLAEALRGRALRRELASLGGYQTNDSGQLVAEVAST